jgi:hypothetical protein
MAMQKYEGPNLFHSLGVPADVINMIFQLLPLVQAKVGEKKEVETMGILALTCHLFYNLTQKNRLIFKLVESHTTGNRTHSNRLFELRPNFTLINKVEAHYFEPKLVECSVGANQEQMQRLLTLHPALAAKKHLFTDWSGRTFNCSVFQYAFWSKDLKYMCPMMLDCLPLNKEGEAIRIQLKEQAQGILDNGLSYQLNGKHYQEKFFSLEPLKQVLKTYIDNYTVWTGPERQDHWCTKVGQVQLLLPAYIRQHYCDPEESFYDKPTFTKAQFKRSLEFINWVKNGITEIWSGALIGLGLNFAICRFPGAHADRGRPAWACGAATLDFAAITALDKMRTETDLPLLMQRLDSPLQRPEDISESQCVSY